MHFNPNWAKKASWLLYTGELRMYSGVKGGVRLLSGHG